MVIIECSGTKYWTLQFDMFPVTKLERFTVIDFGSHISPLYELYSNQVNLPAGKRHCSGGTAGLRMRVKKEDAEMLAQKLFNLLVILAQRDQEEFDQNPFEVDENVSNSEGFNRNILQERFDEMDEKELIRHWKHYKLNQPYHKKYLSWIEEELTGRFIEIPKIDISK